MDWTIFICCNCSDGGHESLSFIFFNEFCSIHVIHPVAVHVKFYLNETYNFVTLNYLCCKFMLGIAIIIDYYSDNRLMTTKVFSFAEFL